MRKSLQNYPTIVVSKLDELVSRLRSKNASWSNAIESVSQSFARISRDNLYGSYREPNCWQDLLTIDSPIAKPTGQLTLFDFPSDLTVVQARRNNQELVSSFCSYEQLNGSGPSQVTLAAAAGVCYAVLSPICLSILPPLSLSNSTFLTLLCF